MLISRAPRGAPASAPSYARYGGQTHAAVLPHAKRDWGRIALQYTPLLAVTVLAKVAVPPLGRIGLGIDLPVLLGAMLAGLCLGRFRVHTGRLLLYLLMLGWLGGAQLLHGDAFSAASIALLAALFLPLTLQLRPPAAAWADTAPDASLQAMSNFAAFFALCGVLQYGVQGVIGTALAFPLEHLLPPGLLIQKYNYLIPVREGAAALKANGVFFLEPSFYSQFMALGLLLELSLRKRLMRIALLVGALAVSYSGTGVIVAGVGIACLVVLQRRWDLLLLAAAAALIGVMLAEVLQLQSLLGRAAEFQSSHSSASARFVAWIDLFRQQWWTNDWRVLFGAGAGSFSTFATTARLATAEMSFSKMLFEFGVVGALLFFGFLVYAVNSVRAPLAFRLGLVASLFLNGAYSAFAVGIVTSVLLWPAECGPARLRPVHRRAPRSPPPPPASERSPP